MRFDREELAQFIDHTLLKPEATPAMVDKLCAEAIHHRFWSVCIAPVFVRRAADHLAGTGVKICTVIGFPGGYAETTVKAYEAQHAVECGAEELDMVMHVGALKGGDAAQVVNDIAAVVDQVDGHVVKVILETCLLTDEEKREACRLAVTAGAQFVKTSTGFSQGGASVADVRLMRAVVGPDFGVKASGGIRDYETAVAMLDAGADRLGTSSGLTIIGVGQA